MLFLHLVFSPKHQQQPLCWKRVKSVFKPPNNFLLLYLFRSGYRSQGSIEEEDSDFGDPRHRLLAANGSNSGFKRWKNFGNRNLWTADAQQRSICRVSHWATTGKQTCLFELYFKSKTLKQYCCLFWVDKVQVKLQAEDNVIRKF